MMRRWAARAMLALAAVGVFEAALLFAFWWGSR